ncbi:MAG: hypothetical protein MJ237_06160 [bacterium]|nr:hypothetical protein [bacterium]
MKTFESVVENVIRNIKGCQFGGLEYESKVKLTKAQAADVCGVDIRKIVRTQVQFNFSYENAVANRASKEQGEKVEFTAMSLPWGKWVDGQVNKLIENKGALYVRYYGLSGASIDVQYFVDGKPATAEQIAKIKQYTEREPSARQTEAGLTENQVIARCVALANIISISVNGEKVSREQFALAA